MSFELTKAVAFIIFNRPDTTLRVFEEIRRARPPKLFVIADGPRTERPGEIENCRNTRSVVEMVDWPCEVFTNFSEANMGCKSRVTSGLNWVFEEVEEAIILEDDCLPHPTFFRYCSELLDRYRDEERILMITGDNFQFGRKRTNDSYYFSRLVHIWGWATWRRSWALYDPDIKRWPEIRDTDFLLRMFGDQRFADHWRQIWDWTYASGSTWAYQLALICLLHDRLTIAPDRNLVSNIGFGSDATHTSGNSSRIASLPVFPVDFPMKHPASIQPNFAADRSILKYLCDVENPGLIPRIKSKLKLMFNF